MKWTNLIKPYRLGCPKNTVPNSARTEFEKKFDRIVFSTDFRRLTGKHK